MSAVWTDIHTHLNFLEVTPDEAIRNAEQAGVGRIITIGTEPHDLPIVLELSQRNEGRVWCTLGIHPHEAEQWNDDVEAFLRAHLGGPHVVAIGEIGLDYYYKNSDPEVQRQVFRKQLELCAEFQMPFEIHTRDAEEDTVTILEEFEGRVRGVIHCFTGTQWLADQCLRLGHNLSFSGIVTFKNAQDLRDVVRNTPLERLHVETDAPFLAPVPHRGKKNQPCYVIHTAEVVASLQGVSLLELAQATEKNADEMFFRPLTERATKAPT